MSEIAWSLASGLLPVIFVIVAACIGIRLIVVGSE